MCHVSGFICYLCVGNPFYGTLGRPFHFRQWLRVCPVKIVTSYFSYLFPTCQQVLGHACHIWYCLWPKSLTHNLSTRAGPGRVRFVMTGMFDRKWKGRACVPKHWKFLNGFKTYLQFLLLIKTHDLFKGSNMIVCVLLLRPHDRPAWRDNTLGSLTPTIHTQSCLIRL